jgi:hypothetical protein
MEVTEGALSGMRKVLGSPLCDSNALLSGVREPISYFQYFFTYLGEIVIHNLQTRSPSATVLFVEIGEVKKIGNP